MASTINGQTRITEKVQVYDLQNESGTAIEVRLSDGTDLGKIKLESDFGNVAQEGTTWDQDNINIIRDGLVYKGSLGGVANVYTFTITNLVSYTDNLTVIARINISNTGSSTININNGTSNLGAVNIQKEVGGTLEDVEAGDMPATKFAVLQYCVTDNVFHLLNPELDLSSINDSINTNTNNITTNRNNITGLTNREYKTVILTGTNSYSGTIDGLTSYTTDLKIIALFQNVNTGNSTININNIGVSQIRNGTSQAVVGELLGWQTLYYDGTSFQVLGNDTREEILNKINSSTPEFSRIVKFANVFVRFNSDGTVDTSTDGVEYRRVGGFVNTNSFDMSKLRFKKLPKSGNNASTVNDAIGGRSATCFTDGDIIYSWGGVSNPGIAFYNSSTGLAENELPNTRISGITSSIYNHTVIKNGRTVYLIGGTTTSGFANTSTRFNSFDLDNRTITQLTSIPIGVGFHVSFLANNSIWLFPTDSFDRIFQYDLSNQTWSTHIRPTELSQSDYIFPSYVDSDDNIVFLEPRENNVGGIKTVFNTTSITATTTNELGISSFANVDLSTDVITTRQFILENSTTAFLVTYNLTSTGQLEVYSIDKSSTTMKLFCTLPFTVYGEGKVFADSSNEKIYIFGGDRIDNYLLNRQDRGDNGNTTIYNRGVSFSFDIKDFIIQQVKTGDVVISSNDVYAGSQNIQPHTKTTITSDSDLVIREGQNLMVTIERG